MSTIAGIQLGSTIQGIMGGEAYLLRRYANGPRSSDPSGGYDRVRKEYPFRGYPSATQRQRIDGQPLRGGTFVFGCYGNTIEVQPKSDDEVVDSCGCVYVVYAVDGDSTSAVHVLYCTEVRS